MLENQIVQEEQRLAYEKFEKTLPTYQKQNTKLQTATAALKAKIKKVEQSIKRANEKLKKKKPGKVTETAKKVKKRRIQWGWSLEKLNENF